MKYQKPQLTYDELAAALMKTNAELKEMEQSRSEFYANISHDLRSPLAALKSSVEYLQSLEHVSDGELTGTLSIMEGRIKVMETMVNDMFLLTTLENTDIPFHTDKVMMGPFLEEFFFEREMEQRYSKRKLILTVPFDLKACAMIDADKFMRLLDNLFTNALKYSKDGDEIELGAGMQEHELAIWVRDSGIGIPADKVKRVFDRTFTVSKARTPDLEKSGCGLGLSIAKTIAERMGGRIECESKEGEGSVFTIFLPVIS